MHRMNIQWLPSIVLEQSVQAATKKKQWMNDPAETMNISPAHYLLNLAQIL